MRGAAKTAGIWVAIIVVLEGLTAYFGHRMTLWGAATVATIILVVYALLEFDFQFLQPWLWHTVGGLLGVAMLVGVVAAVL
ncbi:hypothetical protein [Cryptosporangium aurantiacum]|uniref:Uncharacterized protein n=1 Tax=Cryptosporangium aurantiacum TaxID=134849 RepID=A0A1M7RNQ2_9ACTN|nr:hypothetical protein [Cryptosporangium aurantiacum]SHN47722.1 hypothetical protein SAMN05443668_12725 [Cryptosporangium aurantiacum]